MQVESRLREEAGSRRDMRRYRRTVYSVPITLHRVTTHGMGTSHGISLDISKGGLGALIEGELHVGETVELELPLRRHSLNAVAVVRHTSSVRSGFEFVDLAPEQRLHIAGVVGES